MRKTILTIVLHFIILTLSIIGALIFTDHIAEGMSTPTFFLDPGIDEKQYGFPWPDSYETVGCSGGINAGLGSGCIPGQIKIGIGDVGLQNKYYLSNRLFYSFLFFMLLELSVRFLKTFRGKPKLA